MHARKSNGICFRLTDSRYSLEQTNNCLDVVVENTVYGIKTCFLIENAYKRSIYAMQERWKGTRHLLCTERQTKNNVDWRVPCFAVRVRDNDASYSKLRSCNVLTCILGYYKCLSQNYSSKLLSSFTSHRQSLIVHLLVCRVLFIWCLWFSVMDMLSIAE